VRMARNGKTHALGIGWQASDWCIMLVVLHPNGGGPLSE
jgi:hypothetical protein